MKTLENALNSIKPVSEEEGKKAKLFWDSLAHPPGSLGALEEMTVRLAKIKGFDNLKIDKKITAVFCADNGVYAEKITSQPQITTFLLAEIMHTGKTGLGTISKWAGSGIRVYDVGMIKTSERKDVINKKIKLGTENIAQGPAMSREDCIRMIETGIEAAFEIADEGFDIAGIGELGICNTTTTAAVLSGLCGVEPELTVGRGASTTEAMYELKIKTVKKAIEINAPKKGDSIDCISKVGGFDIAAMCGCYIGLAALCAVNLNPLVRDYLFASHKSEERGATICTAELGIEPVLNMKMRLGEGSGCPLLFKMLEGAVFTMQNMGKFTETMIDGADLVDIRKNTNP